MAYSESNVTFRRLCSSFYKYKHKTDNGRRAYIRWSCSVRVCDVRDSINARCYCTRYILYEHVFRPPEHVSGVERDRHNLGSSLHSPLPDPLPLHASIRPFRTLYAHELTVNSETYDRHSLHFTQR